MLPHRRLQKHNFSHAILMESIFVSEAFDKIIFTSLVLFNSASMLKLVMACLVAERDRERIGGRKVMAEEQ